MVLYAHLSSLSMLIRTGTDNYMILLLHQMSNFFDFPFNQNMIKDCLENINFHFLFSYGILQLSKAIQPPIPKPNFQSQLLNIL